MEGKAFIRMVRMSPRKVRIVANMIRGKRVGDAMGILSLLPKKSAKVIHKLVSSAAANVEDKSKGRADIDALVVKHISVDNGPIIKRFMPRAYGHKVGDTVLQKLSEISRATLRDIDVIGRVGGEEFAILLPETGNDQAIEAAERLRAALATAKVAMPSGLPLQFTVSLGVATLEGKDTNIDMLLNQADQALYKAKSEGRNRVCGYTQSE